MSNSQELKSWLHHHYKTFPESLQFAIKIMQSPEFPVSSKYDVIFEYFCEKAPEYRKNLVKSGEDFDEAWKVINQFLSMPFPITTNSIQNSVIETICNEANKTKKFPSKVMFESVVKIIDHRCYKKFFKGNLKKYSKIIATAFEYASNNTLITKLEKDIIQKVIYDLNNYVKGARINTEFRQIFYEIILGPFVTFVMTQESQGIVSNRHDLLNFMQQLFFCDENLEFYTKLINGEENENLVNVFDTKNASKETLLIIIEAFLKAYKTVNPSFLELLFERLYNPALEILIDEDCLDSIITVLKLLKQYDIKIRKQEIVDEFDMIEYVREKLENLCTEYYEKCTIQILELVVISVSYNPLIMERRSFSVLVNCMFISKESPEVNELYEKFVKTIIRMTNDLRRGEYFVVYLIKAVREKLETYKIPKKLKRKAVTDEKISVKKLKSTSGAATDLDSSFNDSILDIDMAESLTKFKEIAYAWPYNATEQEFSHLISLLTSRQMMTAWRLLCEFLNEELSSLDSACENKFFLIDLLSCLLCQFLSNNQLVEQSHLYWDVIVERCNATKDLLKVFGKSLLHMEHNRRLINAFLSISYEFSSFESLLWYYCPDSIAADKTLSEQYPDLPELDLKKNSKHLFDYLDQDEWKLIEQRIKNFGKFECCFNIGLIHLQKVHAALLFEGHKGFKKNWGSLIDLVMSDEKMIIALLRDDAVNLWFVSHLNKKQMIKVAEILVKVPDRKSFLKKEFMETMEMANVVSLMMFKEICSTKNSVLEALDFSRVLENDIDYVTSFISNMLINKEAGIAKHDPKNVDILADLPFGNVSRDSKTIIFGFLLGLITDLSNSKAESTLQKKSMGCLTLLLHLPDEFPDIFQYYTVDLLLATLTFIEEYKEILYDILNQSIFYMTEVTYETIKKFIKRLKKDASKPVLDLCTIVLKCLSTVHYIKNKKFSKEELEKLEYKYADSIFSYINSEITISDGQELTKVEKKFIKNSSEAFQVLLKSYIGRKNKTDDLVEEHNKLLQIYLKAMESNTCEDTTNLAVIVLENKAKFQLGPEVLSNLVQRLWNKFIQIVSDESIDQEKTKKNIISLILTLKTKEELETILTDIQKTIKSDATNIDTVSRSCRTLLEIAEHGISKSKTNDALEKNNIFGIFARQILFHIITHTFEDKNLTSQECFSLISLILKTQITITSNIRVPISSDMVNDCISFMLKINLKGLRVVDTESVTIFVDLHKLIAELMFVLVAHRSDQSMNYLSSLLLVYKDLLFVISLYKSARPADENLNNSEIALLADLAHKVEKITNQLIKHDRALKLVTPFLITSVIETMTASKRSTTLHDKVKNIFKNICYSLIDITDSHHHKFILRSSNEATRDIYNLLYKEYQKFRAFRGKV